MNKSSSWTALRNPAFRRLWIATVISGTCMAAHDSAATWMMSSFTGSAFLISLLSTLASLPFFLFTLPAGALADKIDRKKLICFINVGLAGTAGGLAVLGWLHLLNPYVIVMPVVGLKMLHFSSSSLGLLFTSMGAGSVVGAVFIIPWLRARLSSDCLTLLANLLLVWVYVLMAFVRQPETFFTVAALAGVGWTLSASELWVAAQRAIPGCSRGRMNATVIMISQGAMAVGGVIWGSAASLAGPSYTLLGAATLFLGTLLLTRRLSINIAGNLEERDSHILSIPVESIEVTPIALTEQWLAA